MLEKLCIYLCALQVTGEELFWFSLQPITTCNWLILCYAAGKQPLADTASKPLADSSNVNTAFADLEKQQKHTAGEINFFGIGNFVLTACFSGYWKIINLVSIIFSKNVNCRHAKW